MRPIHDRMPVVLDPDAEGAWLDPDSAADDRLDLLVPAPDDALVAREVSDLVNDVRKDGPALIEPREEPAPCSSRARADQAGRGRRRWSPSPCRGDRRSGAPPRRAG